MPAQKQGAQRTFAMLTSRARTEVPFLQSASGGPCGDGKKGHTATHGRTTAVFAALKPPTAPFRLHSVCATLPSERNCEGRKWAGLCPQAPRPSLCKRPPVRPSCPPRHMQRGSACAAAAPSSLSSIISQRDSVKFVERPTTVSSRWTFNELRVRGAPFSKKRIFLFFFHWGRAKLCAHLATATMALMGDGEVHNMVVGMAPPPDLEAHAPLPPLDEHHPLADVVDLKDLREVPEKKVSD